LIHFYKRKVTQVENHMEGLGAEVSAKIRSAIKAKLIELEAYVDDELPDYIMVMVANNRTKEQMEEDLGLFLNNNTAAFTNWLHAVLEKLKKVTLEEVSKKTETKKKKVKKPISEKTTSKKSVKEPIKDKGRDDRRSRVTEKFDKKSSRPSTKSPRGTSKRKPLSLGGKDNANLEELGVRRKKTSSSTAEISGGTDGYDPGSLLKSAVSKSKRKESPKKSFKKSVIEPPSTDRDSDPKHLLNLKEEEDFYNPKSREGRPSRRTRTRSRSRGGYPGGRGRSLSYDAGESRVGLASQVVRPLARERERARGRSYSRERERGLSSRAMVPPRPHRPSGREERGGARAVNRAMLEADRSIMAVRRKGSPEWEREREEPRHRDREREQGRHRVPKLSPEDLHRYDSLVKTQVSSREEGLGSRDKRQVERDTRDRRREEVMRLHRRQEKGQEAGRDRSNRPPRHEERIIVRRELSPQDDQKDIKKKHVSRLEDEDAELLEMRRKALESLMRRTDKDILERKKMKKEENYSSSSNTEGSSDESDGSGSDIDTTLDKEETSDCKKKAEPTFIVTMNGIDDMDKYFKKSTAPKGERIVKDQTRHDEIITEPLSESKASSDAELELHANEDFDEEPTKVVHKVISDKPTMKVAARKRSPVNFEPKKATNPESKKIATVKPVIASKAKPSTISASKLAATYAAKLTAIKAAKPKAAVPVDPVSTADGVSDPINSGNNEASNISTASVKTAEANVPSTVNKPARLIVSKKLVPTPTPPVKVPSVSKFVPTLPSGTETTEPPKPKKKFTPIRAPSPERAGAPRLESKDQFSFKGSTLGSVRPAQCKNFPNCQWKDACAFYHPPQPNPIIKNLESLPGAGGAALKGGANKYKWKAT